MQITLLDGSIGQELVHRHGAEPTPLWSTMVMLDRADLVRALHEDYFAAGATIASTNSYPVLPDRLAGTPLEPRLEELLMTAAACAEAARDMHGSGRIAGTLGPLGASYRTDFDHGRAEALAGYAPLLETLGPHVDFFLAETVSSLNQAANMVMVLAQSGRPGWIAFSVDDTDGTRLRSGEPLTEAAALIDHPHVEAVLVNCCRPEAVPAALGVLSGFGKPFGAYANGFERISEAFLQDKPTVAVLDARPDLSPAAYAEHALAWVGQGATIVGGCCEIGPAHIAAIATALRDAGHEIV
ncbi:homocysteine S-methyltransferase [Rhodobacterales bacterium HKCCE3408]|nr:homocysteine S-methyltransferase [Rhodobacterales bacterium HKCCE3408]